MLELQHITKSYPSPQGRRYIFRDLSFSFPVGANVGLTGRNGAGKSTLLRILGGIDMPDSGRVYSEGSISWPVGLNGGFLTMLSARENVEFVCRIQGSHGRDMRAKVDFVREFADIGDYFELPMKSFSSGMRSRVAFGLSMAFDFDYYLIDEVMAVGDAEFRKKSRRVMRDRLKRANLIITSHNMADIRQYCDLVVVVDRGNTVLHNDVEAGIKSYQGSSEDA